MAKTQANIKLYAINTKGEMNLLLVLQNDLACG